MHALDIIVFNLFLQF